MNLTASQAIGEMWSLADKPERLRTFHKIITELDTSDLDAEKFWSQFWSIWQSSENLFDDGDYFHDLIEFGRTLGEPREGLEEEEIAALDAMPDVITIYRGGLPLNHIGWSWTTDRDKAKWFAGRAYGDTQRWVMKTTVRKEDVLGYLMGRGESEIVLDPDTLDLEDVTIDEKWESKDLGPGLFHAIQTGRMLDNPELDDMRARMMVATMKPENFERTRASFNEAVEFSKWAGLARSGYYEAMLRWMKRVEAGEVIFPKTAEDAVGFQI